MLKRNFNTTKTRFFLNLYQPISNEISFYEEKTDEEMKTLGKEILEKIIIKYPNLKTEIK